MSRTTTTLPSTLLDELMAEVRSKSKTDAVITAIRADGRKTRLLFGHYWKVVAYDGKGGATESAVWSFVTQ